MEPSANGMSTYVVHPYDGTDVSRRITSVDPIVPAARHEVVAHPPPEQVLPELEVTTQYARPELASFLNGYVGRRSFEETRAIFHHSVYAWLLPLDFYRWSIGSHIGSETVCRAVPRTSRRFGLLLHTRGNRRLTLTGLQIIERVDRLERNTFHARAARFNELFGELPPKLRPFHFYEFDDIRGRSEPAYQMHPGRQFIVVVGPADGTPIEAVDWQYFMTPPDTTEARLPK